MDLGPLIALLMGSTVIGTLISSLFTRKSTKESNEIQLLDRAYKEIERLDSRISDLENDAKDLIYKLADKEYMYQRSEAERKKLVRQLDDTLWKLQETRRELDKIKKEIKGGKDE